MDQATLAMRNKVCIVRLVLPFGRQPGTSQKEENIMANFTYGTQPFMSTTFTSPLVGTSDTITANVLDNFTINGNGGNDTVTTGSGNDTITTTSGDDVIQAGNGNNTVTAGDGTNAVTTGSGNDTITTGSGADTVNSGSGHDTITTGSGADTVNSGSGNDTITAGSGNDIINAGSGDDTVNAGTGNDRITAGAGVDLLTGGGGHDRFVYSNLADARLGADKIYDFGTSNPNQNGEGDVLDLRGLVDDFSGQSGSSLSQLVDRGYLDFSGDSTNTVIKFDSNGSSAGGVQGTLVTLVGVGFSTEGNAVNSFADNVLV
jgi:Ca2+-binding RTX toxin-like protein